MKRVLLVLFIILLIPSAFSFILLDNTERSTYNLGDKIGLSGYALQDEDFIGKLQVDLSCEEKTPLLIKYIVMRRGEKFDISEKLSIPLSTKGECTLLVSLFSDDRAIEQTQTNEFLLTNNLTGSFSLADNRIQLGKTLELGGKITKVDGTPFNGIATVYLVLNEETHVIETTSIENGIFDYKYNTENNVPGEYTFNVEVNDIYGNKAFFVNVASFSLVSEISVFASTNKESALPGTAVTIFGTANTILQEKIEEGKATITIQDKSFITDVKRNGQFDFRLDLPEDIPSGPLTIKVAVDDISGNRGEAETTIEILSIPTEIEIELPEGTFRPGDKISIKPSLFDQAGNLLDELVNLEILDTNRKAIFQDSIKSNIPIEFTFPMDSIPGAWKIIGSTSKVKEEKDIFIGELQALDFRIENETLVIVNIGNVKYTTPIEIKLASPEFSTVVTKKTSINKGGELKINLAREVDPGVYDVEIGDRKFENVNITSSGLRVNLNFLYWIAIIIVIIALIYIAFFRTRNRIIRKLRERKKVEKKYTPKKEKKIDISQQKLDFRNQILKQIEDRDKKIKKKLSFKFKKEKPGGEGFKILGKEYIEKEKKKEEQKKKGGLFSMFD